jgi:hypothetical protein
MWLAVARLCYPYLGGLEEGRNALLFLCNQVGTNS